VFLIDHLILLSAVLILIGVFASKLSARFGLPLLVLFLGIGMLAGEDGIGGIAFDNASAAHALGTIALIFILFDGGLQTQISSIKQVWKPASVLATGGVLLTAIITGLAATLVLGLEPLQGLLLGAIVGSTDAAAVFSLLRNAGIHLNPRLKATLEIESASNDPMAIFLTIGLLEILVNDMGFGFEFFMLFVKQMGIGAICGLLVGRLAVWLINKSNLTASGLYLVMVAAFGLLAFGLAAHWGGSGFLSVFITGVILGNSRFVFQQGTFLFHDGLAWLSQITMFVILGLLINPSSLQEVWLQGLVIAIVLTFIARPLAVAPILKKFNFSKNEIILISWVGLRGSVPIILAIFPLLFGMQHANLIFNVVFFVVLISATLQGSTLPWVAKKLGLIEKAPAVPAAILKMSSLSDINAEIVEYTLGESSKAVGRTLSQAALPEQAVAAMITRGKAVIPPRGSTLLQADDHLFIILKPEERHLVDLVFSAPGQGPFTPILPIDSEIRLKGIARVADIRYSYELTIDADDQLCLDELIRQQLPEVKVGSELQIDEAFFKVEAMIGHRISTVLIKRKMS
tara:strand:+ start:3853 stop:5568 length:1716 start_codon:yes stop_codon:yes gene_type:complete